MSSVDPPPFSDGQGKECWPCPVVTAGQRVPKDPGDAGVYRHVQPADHLYGLWLAKLATATPTNAPLSRLPDGYHLFQHLKKGRQDAYLFGHPSRRKFRSPNEFLPHVAWLFRDNTHNHANCECTVCGAGGVVRSRKRKLDGRHVEAGDVPGSPSAARGRTSQGQHAVIVVDEDAVAPPRAKKAGSARIIEISDEEDSSLPPGRGRQRSSEKPPTLAGSAEGGAADAPSSEPADRGGSPDFKKPTFWEGKIRYKGAAVETIALRLQVDDNDMIISPRESYWSPCPLFASFPLELRVENGVTTEVAEQMTQTASRYVGMSIRHSPILWAYHVLVLPSFRPESSTKEENARMFEKLRDAMKAGSWAAFIKQDKIQFVLRPTGNYFTGYAMLEDAIQGWSNGKERPVEIET